MALQGGDDLWRRDAVVLGCIVEVVMTIRGRRSVLVLGFSVGRGMMVLGWSVESS